MCPDYKKSGEYCAHFDVRIGKILRKGIWEGEIIEETYPVLFCHLNPQSFNIKNYCTALMFANNPEIINTLVNKKEGVKNVNYK